MSRNRTTPLLVLASSLVWGQSPGKPLLFDAASIKPASQIQPGGAIVIGMKAPTGGPGTPDPGRIHYPVISLKRLLLNAYNVNPFQIVGPAFLDTEFFEVEATMPPDTTPEQFRGMLQNLLADRFKLTLHREPRELTGYTLEPGKGAPEIKESNEPIETPTAPPQRLQTGPDGYLIAPKRPGVFVQDRRDSTRLTFQQTTMQGLAGSLQSQLDRPVTDATHLTAKYDFTLTFTPENRSAIPIPLAGGGAVSNTTDVETPSDIFTAVQSQLGLKLEPKKESIDTIVIDRVEKTPTAN